MNQTTNTNLTVLNRRGGVLFLLGLVAMLFISISGFAQSVSSQRTYASLLYARLTGTMLPIDAPILTTMENQINSGDLLGAANTAINDPANAGFYNVTIREFASIMSTDLEVPNSPTTDFVADIVGATRDDLDARQLLTGNFTYVVDATKVTTVPNNFVNDIAMSNNHYGFIDTNNVDMRANLIMQPGQLYLNAAKTASVQNPDPAGVLTTRGFLINNANGGTNRRMVKFPIREFLCYDIADYAADGPDAMVGRDVDRAPGGDVNQFETKCKTCHNRLDSMRPAWAQFDMDANMNYVEHAAFNPLPCTATTVDYTGNGNNTCKGQYDPNNVAIKMNRNSQVYPSGYQITNASWWNPAVGSTYQTMFGWGATTSGVGANQFGQMLAQSAAFPRCMAQRAFQSVCGRAPSSAEINLIQQLGQNFSASWNYDLKTLWAQVAILPNCLGTPN